MKPPSAQRRENIKLLVRDWIALDAIATKTKSWNLVGTRKGWPSWRCLLRRIAQGELVVISKAEHARLTEPPAPVPLPEPPKASELITVKRPVGRPLTNAWGL